jgi:hypothetical protein
MSPLSREAILTVLSGLTVLACDKGATVAAEPAGSAHAAAAPSAASSPAKATQGASVAAKEVPSAQGSTEKEKSCAPGGCAAGACGANKKK